MTTHTYFDRSGNQIEESRALRSGVLRDGCTMRVGMRARDNNSVPQITDGTTDAMALHRPGYRTLTVVDKRSVHDAYAKYQTGLINSYRLKDGQRLCGDCDGSGYDIDGDACPTCGGDGTVSDLQGDKFAASSNGGRRNDQHDARPLDQMLRDHATTTARLIAERDAADAEAYRRK